MLFVLSACPSIYGWKAVEIVVWVPYSFVRCCQEPPVKWVSRSETMALGRPWSLKYASRYIAEKRSAVRPSS